MGYLNSADDSKFMANLIMQKDVSDCEDFPMQHLSDYYIKHIYGAENNAMAIKEKKEFLDKASTFVSEKLLKEAKYAKKIADEYREDVREHWRLAKQLGDISALVSGFATLQGACSEIVKEFNGGKPNESEKYLSRVNIEKALRDFPNNKGLDFPQQEALPVLFGREKEEKRRGRLNLKVQEFNEKLQDFQEQVKNGNYVEWIAYSGRLLDGSSVKSLETKRDEIMVKMQKLARKIKEKYTYKDENGIEYVYNKKDADYTDEYLQKWEKKLQTIEKEKQNLLKREQQLKSAARAVIVPESSLQPVPASIYDEAKSIIRKANKQY